MPKRVVDGDALWTSDKLALVEPEWMRGELANLIPLALPNNSFECDARKIWSRVYAYNRPSITPDIVEQILHEFRRVKILFTWQDGGKTWGFWIGSEKDGRCLSPSQIHKYAHKGPGIPVDALKEFLSSDSVLAMVRTSPSYGQEASTLWSANLLQGEEEERKKSCLGTGTGTVLTDGASLLLSPAAGTESPAPPVVPHTSTPASLPTSRPGTIVNPVEQRVAAARARTTPTSTSAPTATVPAKSTSTEKWDPIDFVFELPRDSDWNGIPVKELRRVVWYHWRDSESDKYWTTTKANISSEDRLAKNIERMAQQTPDHAYVPGWATMEVRTIDPACQLCKGVGHTKEPHPDYPDRMHASIAYECSCLSPDPKPWRRLYKD
jgi:hypothetical protein